MLAFTVTRALPLMAYAFRAAAAAISEQGISRRRALNQKSLEPSRFALGDFHCRRCVRV